MRKNDFGNKDENHAGKKRNNSATKHRSAYIAAAVIMGVITTGSVLTSSSLSSFLPATLLQTAYADVTVGSGEGSIIYRAHRMQDDRWDPCFATKCNVGSGPGAAMFFTFYDGSHVKVGEGYADETGTLIKGLVVGQKYFLSPEDCGPNPPCHPGAVHKVEFDHWANDGDRTRQNEFTIASSETINADACYAFVKDGVRSNGACSAGGPPPLPPPSADFSISTSPSSIEVKPGTSGSTTITVKSLNSFTSAVSLSASSVSGLMTTFSANPITPTSGGSATSTLTIAASSTAAEGTHSISVTGTTGSTVHADTVTVIVLANPPPSPPSPSPTEEHTIKILMRKQLVEQTKETFGSPSTVSAEADNTTESNSLTFDNPSTNLSSQPIGSDPSLVYAPFSTLYEVINPDPQGSSEIIRASQEAGIERDSLSEAQQAHVILKVQTR